MTASNDIAARSRRDDLAARALRICEERSWHIAAAESLTGGLLADSFVRIPGASRVFLGSAVTYDIHAKAGILGVDADLLDREGAVHPQVAMQMACATARLYTTLPEYHGTVVGLSTTGVAGPGPDGDKPAGLVYIGISLPCEGRTDENVVEAQELHLSGTREQVRLETVEAVLKRLNALLDRSV
ncbi:CinA family protein [Bifidobacterium callimiconis]|uniref:Damage-inducible protein CinA n=1 Tax=Bifidobacterium callimiconis TaxID=2306973 RepID=A0A430FD01_9BIFI|nr:nicotinamide-nucleotide amidohydrolase family protein [Bifidobacterium callimiconis]RSX50723.1 damage-inducible protein CinA [Bifidobacterium callimiconis]